MKHNYDDNNLFNWQHKEVEKVNYLKVGTFFSGIGAPENALKRLGINFDLEFFSEINKYAIQAYCSIHNEKEEKNLGDISQIQGSDLPYCDMWFGGFPCQDISLAGNGKGFEFESNTRSSLGWEMIRLIREVEQKPKYIVFENAAMCISNSQLYKTAGNSINVNVLVALLGQLYKVEWKSVIDKHENKYLKKEGVN